MKRLLLTFAVTCSLFPLRAQEVLTLEQCLKIGIENNLSLEARRNDIRKGKHQPSGFRNRRLCLWEPV